MGPYSKTKEFEPVYAVKGKITVKGFRRFMNLAFSQFGEYIHETLPLSLLKNTNL